MDGGRGPLDGGDADRRGVGRLPRNDARQNGLSGVVDLSAVVETGLEDDEVVAVDEVDEAVLLGDPTGPCPGQHVAQGLGLADAGGRVAQRVVDEPVDPRETLPVRRQSAGVVVRAVGGEDELHGSRSCSTRMPERAWRRLSSRCAVVALRAARGAARPRQDGPASRAGRQLVGRRFAP
ncbi:hypothetical protein MOPEL_021_00030 [Mobilicoccus pelagius NBRC 104925]|uniref:Uncharacterized protein n=1 Tax=Mobilicoccus pelagius NBRC 104925 TaxID=1089455 RepID=H5UPB0_9MICO|nr:hypothetical protein MOPEL_021_00030 [Mobilicoccus pelagius NBRC 104925]